jgi:membrane protein implicated in regulation of membrane protease activity
MEMHAVWMWSAVAAILLAGEILTTSFVLLFFAFAAGVTALVTLVQPDFGVSVQLIVFGIIGLASLVAGRRWIKAKMASKSAPAFYSDSNAEFNSDRDMAPGAEGAVMYQGSPWTAVNDGSEPILAGDRVRVARTAGIKIMIVKVK